MSMHTSRRDFLRTVSAGAAAAALGGALPAFAQAPKRTFGISLAFWSLHRTVGKKEGQVSALDVPKMAREEFGIDAVELVNHMLASDEKPYLDEFARNAAAANTKILLIMVDGQGDVGSRSENIRGRCVENHKKWIDIAADFGCHSIRMNWGGAPKEFLTNAEELQAFIERSVPGFQSLCVYGETKNVNILLENHWGPSSYPDIVERLIAAIDHPRFGMLPDFGNFPEDVDRYDAIDRLMKHAKAVSAKCYDFDDATGEETTMDFPRILDVVCDKHGYDGYIGIEYEGNRLPERDGILACKKLLEKLRG
ncbi:MAG TPA: TIM barrel protein [Candidatus Hydrogenedentes bacterium]|nr:TIM barrel protein [Candidatus Hydrogenedentota bacterium]HNT86255.1 TIM barrel protein [Candidatus Hydrogenedentota bacterium]